MNGENLQEYADINHAFQYLGKPTAAARHGVELQIMHVYAKFKSPVNYVLQCHISTHGSIVRTINA